MSEARRPRTHCSTCVCDPTSARAIARANQVAPLKVSKEAVLVDSIADARAFAYLLRWFDRSRRSPGSRLKVIVIAHREDIEFIFLEPPAEPPPAPRATRFRRGRPLAA